MAMSPKRIVNVDLRYLPKCTEFFIQILENKNLFQTLGKTGSYREGA